MFDWLRHKRAVAPDRLSNRRVLVRPARVVRGRYDAAQTTSDNERHWANADFLAADAANSPEVRRALRCRARYEVANNSYAKGIVLTLANDVVGTGPRLQMLARDPAVNQAVERAFSRWARDIDLASKLRTMQMARVQDGEAFALMVTNPAVPGPVKLDLRLIEADQVATPTVLLPGWIVNPVDGIVLDDYGNPSEYHVLKYHPGATNMRGTPLAYERVPPDAMIHTFRCDRPGQHRGVPEITPALSLFAQLRRYTQAVLDAAETAADNALVIQTNAPPDGEAYPIEPMDTFELERRMATTLPEGWQLGQVKAEQPTTTYAEFKKEILNEIARCLNIPFNVAAGNSSGYNYASGRLDHQVYFKQVRLDQSEFGRVILDRLLEAWLEEALLVYRVQVGLLPAGAAGLAAVTHQWFWDGPEHVDPTKEASAEQTRLQDNTTTLADIYARKGQDWETQIRQRAREVALLKRLGLPEAPAPTKPDAAPPGGGPADTPPKDEKPPEDEDAGDEVSELPWSGEEGDAAGLVGACSREAEER